MLFEGDYAYVKRAGLYVRYGARHEYRGTL